MLRGFYLTVIVHEMNNYSRGCNYSGCENSGFITYRCYLYRFISAFRNTGNIEEVTFDIHKGIEAAKEKPEAFYPEHIEYGQKSM